MSIVFLKSESGDWIGMYDDDELVMEGHELSVVEAVGAVVGDDVDVIVKSDEWFEKHGGRCPQEPPKNVVKLAVWIETMNADDVIDQIQEIFENDLFLDVLGLDNCAVSSWEVAECP